jgi:hypothetical protein
VEAWVRLADLAELGEQSKDHLLANEVNQVT